MQKDSLRHLFSLFVLTLKGIRRLSARNVVKLIIYIKSCALSLIGNILDVDRVPSVLGIIQVFGMQELL